MPSTVIAPAADDAPPIDPEFLEPRAPGEPLKVTVRPVGVPLPKAKPKPAPQTFGFTPFDPEKADEAGQAQAARDTAAARVQGKYYGFVPFDPAAEQPPPEPAREVGTGEAGALGLEHGLSMGAAPALHGLSEASKPALDEFAKTQGIEPDALTVSPHVKAALGAAELLTNWMTGHDDPKVKEAYERGRKRALENEQLANDQHRLAYLGGVLAGSVAAPVPGAGAIRPAATGGRILQGLRTGGTAGAAFGAGEEIGKGGSPADVLTGGVKGGVIGAGVGAPLVAAVGPRAITAATPGQRAARTAEDLGAPLPRGVVSDNRQVQGVTAKVTSLPFVGERIKHKLLDTQTAAGERVEDIAGRMAGPAAERSAADAAVRPGIQTAIDTNRATQDALYNGLRGQIDHDVQRFTLPRTDAALNAIMRERQAAGHPNPAQGLEQFRNVAGGATFNGAHRARTDARNAGDVLTPNPGYNAADFNRLTRAMSADLRELVQAAAVTQTPRGRQAALRAFEDAEREFGPLADMNTLLNRLVHAGGEGGIATLLNAAKERGGDLHLLTELRRTMPAQQFQVIGGMLLSELGQSTRLGGEFSLAQFSTNFAKLSDGALRTLYSPQHLANIREIAEMGTHIKRALEGASTSHSSNWLAFLDIMKDMVLLTHDVTASGGLGKETLIGAGTTAAMYGWAFILGNSARTASLTAWTRAYRGLTMNQPTPARQAVFKIATRNLANTLNIPIDRLTQSIVSHVRANQDEDDDLKK